MAIGTGARMLAALALGVPLGALGCGLMLAARHPELLAMLAAHPMLALPATGIGAIAAAFWALAGVLGAGLAPDSLRCWVVVAAACLYLWFDRRHVRAAAENRR